MKKEEQLSLTNIILGVEGFNMYLKYEGKIYDIGQEGVNDLISNFSNPLVPQQPYQHLCKELKELLLYQSEDGQVKIALYEEGEYFGSKGIDTNHMQTVNVDEIKSVLPPFLRDGIIQIPKKAIPEYKKQKKIKKISTNLKPPPKSVFESEAKNEFIKETELKSNKEFPEKVRKEMLNFLEKVDFHKEAD